MNATCNAIALALAITASTVASAVPAYTSKPPSLSGKAWAITEGSQKVSTRFTLTQDVVLSRMALATWMHSGYDVVSIHWSIGTDYFDGTVGAGTATAFESQPIETRWDDVAMATTSFDVGSVALSPGTYYFTLEGLSNDPFSSGYLLWGVVDPWTSNAPYPEPAHPTSTRRKWYSAEESLRTDDVSFELHGREVPEPATPAMLGLALVALLAVRRFRT